MWHAVYPELSGSRHGIFGSLTSRAEAHVLRLSCIYPLLDCSEVIARRHLEPARAVRKYSEDSVRVIFGDALSNPVAERIRNALYDAPGGLTRTDLRDLFRGHRNSSEITTALQILCEQGLAEFELEETGGRTAERWFASSEAARKARKARKGDREG
jgi:hypothetical protein